MSDPRTLEERENYVSIRITNGRQSYKIYLEQDSTIEQGLKFTKDCLRELLPTDGLSDIVARFTDGVNNFEVVKLYYDED